MIDVRRLSVVLALALTACGGDDPSGEPDATNDASDTTTDGEEDVSADGGGDVSDTGERDVSDTSSDAGGDAAIEVPTVELPPTTGLIPDSAPRNPGCTARSDSDTWRPTLADAGCYALETEGSPVVDEAIPYDVNVSLWADRSEKRRYVLLPEGETLGWNATTAFDLPVGTVLIKEFYLDGTRIESRFVEREADGWVAATYVWNESQTDATLVESATEITVGDHQWLLPGTEDCTSCHTRAADFVLGFRGDQLYRDGDMFGQGLVNQVAALNDLGLFEPALEEPLPLSPLSVTPGETTLEHQARSYLAANCGNCHQPGGAPHADIDLRIDTPLADTNACDVYPIAGDLGLRADARIISPGAPEFSVLLQRMDRRDADAMPQLGTFEIDDDAVSLVHEWIDGLADCPE